MRNVVLHRFVDTPLALHPRVTPELFENIRRGLFNDREPEAVAISDGRDDGPGYAVSGGIALIPVTGVLVHGPTMWWDETDYGTLAGAIRAAADDNDVRGIAMQIASPGGEVSGLFDLADTIYSARGKKPIWSIVDDYAFSAAYAIASATDRITVSRTGGVGSVGVVTMHVDMSKMLEEHGINISLVQFGERKTDFSPFRQLSDGARARLQEDVDTIGEMFVGMVARNRGVARSKVIATQAATYMGSAGVEQGLADDVLSPSEAFAKMRGEIA